MSTMKKIITTKNLLIILIIIIIPIAFFYTRSEYNRMKKENEAEIELKNEKIILDSISKIKIYNIQNIEQIGIQNIVIKTKYENDESLFYISADLVDENSVKSKKTNRFPNKLNNTNSLILIFYDKDGFKIGERKIFLDDLTYSNDINGYNVGLWYSGRIKNIDKEDYIRITNCSISWSFQLN